jgi:CDP-diacylglycerol--serine O-phosphatidyltransferase
MKKVSLKGIAQKGKQKLFLIPYVFTFLNALFGFLSIINTLEGNFRAAAYCIILAACMDMLDGRLARAFGSESYLGMELDSLCDVVSFCLAPTLLLYTWCFDSVTPIIFIVLGFYMCAGLFRLAKFNTLPPDQKRYFIGLPTPIAAFFLADLVLRSEWVAQNYFSFLLAPNVLLVIMVMLALLMISPIRFPSGKYYAMRSLSTYIAGGLVLVLLLLCRLMGYPFFFLATVVYIVGGCASEFVCVMKRLLKFDHLS